MENIRTKTSKPLIIVAQTDFSRLSGLAEGALERLPEVADELLGELERASVAQDDQIADNIIRMGSTATYEIETGEERTVTLVYPGDADIATGRVSILTPIGVALLGLAPGQTITWQARDGSEHRLTIKNVAAASATPA